MEGTTFDPGLTDSGSGWSCHGEVIVSSKLSEEALASALVRVGVVGDLPSLALSSCFSLPSGHASANCSNSHAEVALSFQHHQESVTKSFSQAVYVGCRSAVITP